MSVISIKVDSIASMRMGARSKEPDPAHAAVIAEVAGADGISCHLREDRLYIRDRDIYLLKEIIKTRLTVQIAPTEDLISRVLEVKPWMVTLMPQIRTDISSEDIVDSGNNSDLYAQAITTLKESGINVGCFIDPDIDLVKNAARAKVDAVMLNVADYINAHSIDEAESELDRLEQMCQLSAKLGLIVNCGGGLNYRNIRPLIDLGLVEEFIVGHTVISRGLMVGLDRAVREMCSIVHASPIGEYS